MLGGHVQNPDFISYGDVEMSRIADDGSLRPWEIQKTILKTPRFIAAAFAMNRYIYILGGHNGGNRLNSVEFAALDSKGDVGPWSFTAPMHDERSATALAVHGNQVYVLGGMGAGGALNSVEMAEQNDNGHLGHRELPNAPLRNAPSRPVAPSLPANE